MKSRLIDSPTPMPSSPHDLCRDFLARLRAVEVPAAIVALPVADYSAELFPLETQLVERSVEKRRNEFATGRACARRALAKLGLHPEPILSGSLREPLWPAEIVGSITHHGVLSVAAVQQTTKLQGVGIDVADCTGPSADIGRYVCTSGDAPAIGMIADAFADVDPVLAIFSVKEAAYKCLFPSVGRMIDFAEISVMTSPHHDRIVVEITAQADLRSLAARAVGTLIRFDEYFFSAVWMPAAPRGC